MQIETSVAIKNGNYIDTNFKPKNSLQSSKTVSQLGWLKVYNVTPDELRIN